MVFGVRAPLLKIVCPPDSPVTLRLSIWLEAKKGLSANIKSPLAHVSLGYKMGGKEYCKIRYGYLCTQSVKWPGFRLDFRGNGGSIHCKIYRANENCTAKPTEGEFTRQCKNNIVYEHRPSEVWFPSYGLLRIKESAQSVHIEFPCRHFRRHTSGTLLIFATSHWGCLPFLRNVLPELL